MLRTKKGRSAYDEALHFLTPKARTVRETENHLVECEYSEIEIMNTVERLLNNGLLNDAKYAADFVESRLNTKPVSRFKLRHQLEMHFVPDEAISAALEAVDDETEMQNALTVGRKFFRQFDSLEMSERLLRVGARLNSRGYYSENIKTVLDILRSEAQNE